MVLEEWKTLIFMVLEVEGVGDTDIYGVEGWKSGRHRYLWCWRLEEWETLIFMVLEVGGVGDTDIYYISYFYNYIETVYF